MKVMLGVSNRHVHLTKDIYVKLFGDDEFENVRDLKQPGQFASNKFVTIKNGDRNLCHVRVLGPFRNYNQVEISRTDGYFLKLDPPVRDSGDLNGSSPITLVGDKGEVYLDEGCIIAARHIHITHDEMVEYGFDGKEEVKIKIHGEKGGILEHVRFKVADASAFELHLDTDDANAFDIKTGDMIEIMEVD